MRAVLGSAILARIRYLADIQSETARHPDANIYTEITQSYAALRQKVSDSGGSNYLTIATASLAAGAHATGCTFGSVLLAIDCIQIFGVEVIVSTSTTLPVYPSNIEQRFSGSQAYNSTTGRGVPSEWFPINWDNASAITGPRIGITPVPDKAYTLNYYYLAEVPAVAAGTALNCANGWDEWIVQDCVLKIAERENDMLQTAGIAKGERDQCWIDRILPNCTPRRDGPLRRQDTAGLRERTSYRGSR
jgi:hypothetical protein